MQGKAIPKIAAMFVKITKAGFIGFICVTLEISENINGYIKFGNNRSQIKVSISTIIAKAALKIFHFRNSLCRPLVRTKRFRSNTRNSTKNMENKVTETTPVRIQEVNLRDSNDFNSCRRPKSP